MATKLKTFDWSQPSLLTTTDKATYDWDNWFDGDIWELTHREDFYGHPLMMERIIRTRATSKKARIRLRHVPFNGEPWGKLIVQRIDITGPSEARKQAAAEARAAKKTEATTPKVKANGASVNGTNGTKVNGTVKPTKRPRKLAVVK